MFVLHSQLEHDTFFITDLALSTVRLMNNELFPWIILVPRVNLAQEIIDLKLGDRYRLMDEIAHVSQAMKQLFSPDKINIAALGNQVPQLHVHIIARFTSDAAWPHPVWGKECKNYSDPTMAITQIRETLTLATT